MQYLAIAVGGALGALGRFWLSNGVHAVLGRSFPYGTLIVNLLGCLLLGILAVVLQERGHVSDAWRLAISVGFLGAFTTFSTFSLETLLLLKNTAYLAAALNIFFSVLFGILAVIAGMFLGKHL